MSALARARERIRTWRENPLQFAVDNFHVELDAWQVDALKALCGGYRQQRRLALKACTGPGKSALLAMIGWWRLACFAAKGEHPKGAALSVTRDNLKDNLWSELAKWQNRSEFLQGAFTWTKEQIHANDHPSTWFLSARSFTKDADAEAIGRALSGLHSQFPTILLDEMGDMPVQVGRAAEQIFTGNPVDALIAGAGNPTSLDGLLYEVCNRLRELWEVVTITADPDDPKRTPRVDAELAREQIRLHGRDNPWVMATILGLFPSAAFNALVGIEEIEAAMQRFYRTDAYEHAAKVLGVDVAREGNDRSVIAPRQGIVAFKPKVFRNVRSNDLAGQVAQAEEKWQADGVIVDGTGGYGGGVIDALQTMGRTALDCQFAGKAANPKFANKRAEICWAFAEWIKSGGALPYLPELIREATAITYTYRGDAILIKPKDLIKKDTGCSPDLWDAYAVTFAYPIAKRGQQPHVHQRLQSYDPIANAVRLAGNGRGRNDDYDPLGGLQ